VELLPGALVLLGYHLLTLRSGGPGRLQPVEQLIFGASLATAALSVVLLGLLMAVRARLRRTPQRRRLLLQAKLLVLTGLAALSAALAGDFFVVTARLSGSPDQGALAGALLLLLLYVPWL
jgi:hypothetical protein